MNKKISTLHDHPGLQAKLGLDAEHIIVDKSYWVSVRQNTKESPENVSQQRYDKIAADIEEYANNSAYIMHECVKQELLNWARQLRHTA